METVNHEYYVSLEVAKLLKEAGFDWNCYELYECEYEQDGRIHAVTSANWNSSLKYYSAPTLEVAQRWLREVKDVDIMVRIDYHYGEHYSKAYCSTFYIVDDLHTTEHFKTYEEALEAGIKKALELILEKGKPKYWQEVSLPEEN